MTPRGFSMVLDIGFAISRRSRKQATPGLWCPGVPWCKERRGGAVASFPRGKALVGGMSLLVLFSAPEKRTDILALFTKEHLSGGTERKWRLGGPGGPSPRGVAKFTKTVAKFTKTVAEFTKSSLAGKKVLQVSKILLIFVVKLLITISSQENHKT